MGRVCLTLALVALLGVWCLAACAQNPSDTGAGQPLAASQAGPAGLPPERVAQAAAALSLGVEAAEQSKPKPPDRTWGRLFGIAVAALTMANWNSPYFSGETLSTTGAHAAEWSVYGGPASEVSLQERTSAILRVDSEQAIYGTLLDQVDALAQVDGEAASRVATSIKDPYWQARALAQTGQAQLRLGHADVGVNLLLRAVASAQASKLVAVRAAVANRALYAALALRASDPAAAARLRQACEPLVTALPWSSSEPNAAWECAGAKMSFATFLALSDRTGAKALFATLPDRTDRLMAAYTVAIQLRPGTVSLQTGGAFGPEMAGNLKASQEVLLDRTVAPETRTVAYELAGLAQPPPAELASLPLAAEFLDMSLAGDDLDTVSTLLAWLAQGDRDRAQGVLKDSSVRRITAATERSLRNLREREEDSFYASRDTSISSLFRGGLRGVEENPVWSGYLARVARLLGSWTRTVQDLASIDPKLAELAVNSASDPVIIAVGAASLVTPGADPSLRDRMSKTVMSAWDQVKEPRSKGLQRLLFESGSYGEIHQAMTKFFAGELVIRLAPGDVAAACTLLKSADHPYTRLREIARKTAAAAPDQALALLNAWPDESARAGAERYLASLVAAQDADRGLAMYQKADATAQRRFTGRTRPGFLVRQTVDPIEKQSDADARAEDLAALLRALARKDPDRAVTFVPSLSDPYLRCQALRLLLSMDQPFASSLLDQESSWLAAVKDQTYRSQATCDLAVATAKHDVERGLALTRELKDPGHHAWATAMIATRLTATDAAREGTLLRAALADLPQIKEPKRRAYAGYVLARAWLAQDREQVVADLDTPHLEAAPW